MNGGDGQKRALGLITQAREDWVAAGCDRGKVYMEDRDAFYRCVRFEMFPRWIAAGLSESDLEVAKTQHTRADWLASGRTAEAFDRAMRDARRSSFADTAGKEGLRVGLGCLTIVVASFIVAVVRRASSNSWAAILVLVFFVCFVLYGLWRRMSDQPERELTSLKLSDDRQKRD